MPAPSDKVQAEARCCRRVFEEGGSPGLKPGRNKKEWTTLLPRVAGCSKKTALHEIIRFFEVIYRETPINTVGGGQGHLGQKS